MDRIEKIADDYLRRISNDVVYEPDGNVPPDFLMDGSRSAEERTAVEVRRLNENYFCGDRAQGLENDNYRLIRAIRSVVKTFDQKSAGRAYFVSVEFERPLGDLKQIRERVRRKLTEHLKSSSEEMDWVSVTSNVRVRIDAASKPDFRTFRLFIQSDGDGGGLVTRLYVKNANYCIREKTEKISPFQNGYSRWWLVLVDTLQSLSRDDSDDSDEIESVRRRLVKPDVWDSSPLKKWVYGATQAG